MRIRWDPKALERLEAVGHFSAQDSPMAAVRVVERIYDAVDELANFPFKGRAIDLSSWCLSGVSHERSGGPPRLVRRWDGDTVHLTASLGP